MGHNGEAAPHVCVPTNEVSDLIFLLCDFANTEYLSFMEFRNWIYGNQSEHKKHFEGQKPTNCY
ncbi:hypothetical protein F0261_17010 [Alteromonas sp. 07-89-2]|nr:hypothetical protein [Alteromonas sp. 07-89-2]